MADKAVLYYKIFECQKFTTDNYWKRDNFQLFPRKIPKGIRFDNSKNTLHVRIECGK